jgi:hypothetical protein
VIIIPNLIKRVIPFAGYYSAVEKGYPPRGGGIRVDLKEDGDDSKKYNV